MLVRALPDPQRTSHLGRNADVGGRAPSKVHRRADTRCQWQLKTATFEPDVTALSRTESARRCRPRTVERNIAHFIERSPGPAIKGDDLCARLRRRSPRPRSPFHATRGGRSPTMTVHPKGRWRRLRDRRCRPRSTWGCPPLDLRASLDRGDRHHGQGVDNPANGVARADAGRDTKSSQGVAFRKSKHRPIQKGESAGPALTEHRSFRAPRPRLARHKS